MTTDGKEASKPAIPFEVWRSHLRKDCESQDKLLAFQALGDSVLQIFWQRGIEPTVKALLDGNSERSTDGQISFSRTNQSIENRR
jgi:hypothetical protein